MWRSRVLLVLMLVFLCQVESAKILGITHFPSISHYRAGTALMKILAEKGHDVTVVSPFGEKDPPKNYKDIVLEGFFNVNQRDDFFQDFLKMKIPLWDGPFFIHRMVSPKVEAVLKHKEFQKLMNSNEKYDVVILEDFCSMALKYVGHRFKAPLILYSSMDLNDFVYSFQGNPWNPAYTSDFQSGFRTEMNFFERVQNSIHYVISKLALHFLMIPKHNEMLHKYFPDAPDINDFLYNTSLALVNADPSVYEPLPMVPSIINIGGFHVAKPKALPQDLQVLLDNAKNGVIYFSLGSNFKSKFIPQKTKENILRVFSKLKETVLWKFEEDLPGKPDNVIIRKWFPQNDIFAHENIKLFISHGGIFGTIEAVYNGIPILAFPIYGDQIGNVRRAEAAGYAKGLEFSKLEGKEFELTVNELLHNPKYAETAKQRSRIIRDKPISQADSVNFWVEYVIRHKGAEHLKVASLNLTWYQNVLLDVIGFILVCLIAIFITLKYLIGLILRNIKRTDSKKKKNKKKD